MVAGRPAMAFADDSSGHSGLLRFVRANDSTGASWPASTLVATNIAYRKPQLAMISGLPAIAFVDVTDGLYFTIASVPVVRLELVSHGSLSGRNRVEESV